MNTKPGLGLKGKTLKQMLDESNRLWENTGRYYGLEELPLTSEDPLKMELLHSRLISALQSGMETTRMIAASPIMREVSELCCGLYTAEGHCIAQSIGMTGHIPVMGQIIDWMIRQNYEEDVGVNEGDLFCCNENVIAGFHAADVADLSPIFWDGELVAWAGTTCMEAEIGAISPGTLPSANTERFTDGMRIYAEKIGANDRIDKTFETRCKMGLRMPDLFLLDRRGAMGANLRIRDEVKGVIEEFGIEYFRDASRELIEAERLAQLARVRTLTVPGRFRNIRCFEQMYANLPIPPIHRRDQFVLVPMEFTINRTGEYMLDFDGAGPWGWHPTNSTPSALLGGLSVVLVITIAYSGRGNTGTLLATRLNIPYDTMLWPSTAYIATSMTWTPVVNLEAMFMSMQSRAFFSRGFREEIMIGGISGEGFTMGGKNQYGMEPFGFFLVDSPGTGGGGACGIRDGLDSGFAVYLTEPDMGNCEVWETVVPLLWLGREMHPDWCGHGKYRGGFSINTTVMVNEAPYLFVEPLPGLNGSIPVNLSIFGGYPVAQVFRAVRKDPNLRELIENRQPLIHEAGDPRNLNITNYESGTLWGPMVGNNPIMCDEVLHHGDIVQVCSNGMCGGYGDPIERDPALVKKDMDNGLLSLEIARNVYGIHAVFDAEMEHYVVDYQQTQELRSEEKHRRMKATPAKDWWQKNRQKLIQKELPPLLTEMYNNSLRTEDLPGQFASIWNTSGGNIDCRPKGQKWPQEFKAFWGLADDFSF